MAEVRAAERALAIEDLMYVCVLERFQRVGVRLLPALEPVEEDLATLGALTGEAFISSFLSLFSLSFAAACTRARPWKW